MIPWIFPWILSGLGFSVRVPLALQEYVSELTQGVGSTLG